MRRLLSVLFTGMFLCAPLAAAPAADEEKPYDQVITREAKSSKGLFGVHRLKDKLYFEIPKASLNQPFLLVTQVSRGRTGAGMGGDMLDNRVVRWEQKDKKILLRGVEYSVVADAASPISKGVTAINNDAILMSFDVVSKAKDGSPVIDVTKLYTTDVLEWSPKPLLNARFFDASRSFLEKAKAFPENVEVESTLTYYADGQGGRTSSVAVHYSMVKLPEKPMMPRLADNRVGYFTVSQVDYSRPDHKLPRRRYICRWRLEKKDPNAPLSEPVKPITFYIDPATPKQWVPYVKAGVEEWRAAFEEAGFKNAIIAKDPPANDPDWDPEDARYSVIRWLPSPIENAYGPHISDPRSGEILEADIHMFHNITSLLRGWYFVQASPLDPKARRLPLPEDLMGRLVQFVVAHEVGHSLGFPHNMKASSTYPAEKVRDREWVKKMGHTPSIMDYSRFNYVAQPEDRIDPADLIPHVGPYDKFATRWGYAPITPAMTPDDEKLTLDKWAREQDKTPWYRFSTPGMTGMDPGDLTESVGDADAIASTTNGLKNLERVANNLVLSTGQAGEPWDDLSDMYNRLLGQWVRELAHVSSLVGGVNSRQLHGGQDGVLYKPVPKAQQKAAVKFLLDHACRVPAWLLKPEIVRRIEPSGTYSRLHTAQKSILFTLVQPSRLARMQEAEMLDAANSYTVAELFDDLRNGVFAELKQKNVKVDAARRGMQRAYLDAMTYHYHNGGSDSDARALMGAELRALREQLKLARKKTTDKTTAAHLISLDQKIAESFEPKWGTPQPTRAFEGLNLNADPDGCWTDLKWPSPEESSKTP